MKRMIVDIPNLFFRVVAACQGKYSGTPEEKAALALHSCLVTLNKWYKQEKPDQLAVVFEGRNNWRKTYTASEKCKSKVGYKSTRVADPSMAHMFIVLADFEKLVREHTSIVCLQNDILEGDDLIAGFIQYYSGDQIVILSGDKDFTQLLSHSNVTLLNPDKGIPRTCEDPEYFIFEKCFRGDIGDTVPSAYPRIRADKLKKAFNGDEYLLNEIMNHTWSRYNPNFETTETFLVSELYAENNLLMNLDAQPTEVRKVIMETVEHGVNNHGKFSFFHFLKFLGHHELKDIISKAEQFSKMFSCTQENKHKEDTGILTF